MIKGKSINLRAINFFNGEKYREWRNDISIRQWCRQHTLIDEMEQTKWFEKIRSDQTIKMFEIFDHIRPVGVCGFTDINLIHRRAEFSCYVAPEHQGKGYATEALALLFNHGFLDWGFNVIWGETFDDNEALKLFIVKLGMKKEGYRRQFYYKNGKYIGATLISLTRLDYDEIRSENGNIYSII